MSEFRIGQLSITGNYRKNNEDSLYVDEDHRLFLVADGMGGQSAGEKASQLAVELIPRKLMGQIESTKKDSRRIQKAINEAVEYANSDLMALGRIDPEYHNMGTTVVLLLVVDETFYIGNVGDSPAYLLRDGHLDRLTKDHSLVQALIDAGTISPDEARTHRYKNVLVRYLGSKEGGEGVPTIEMQPTSGDRYFLCSDGVTDGLEDDAIQKLLEENQEPQEAAEIIVQSALDGGSRDNITCIVVDVL